MRYWRDCTYAVVINDRDRCRTRRKKAAASWNAERQIDRLIAFDVNVVDYQYTKRLTGFTGSECNRPIRNFVIASLRGGTVARSKINGRNTTRVACPTNCDGGEVISFADVVIRSTELHCRRECINERDCLARRLGQQLSRPAERRG